MSMNSQTKSTILGIATAITISVGVMTVYTQQSDKAHRAAVEQAGLEPSTTDYPDYSLILKRQNYPDTVSELVTEAAKMPVSAERSTFSQAVIDVTADNVISDDEFNRLEMDFEELKAVNEAREVHELVAKYVPEPETAAATTTKAEKPL